MNQSEEELRELSHRAAGCLPKDAFHPNNIRWKLALQKCDGSYINGWLHESTEACTEIFSRLLIPAGVFREVIEAVIFDKTGDPVAAFRVGTLTTLVDLKK